MTKKSQLSRLSVCDLTLSAPHAYSLFPRDVYWEKEKSEQLLNINAV